MVEAFCVGRFERQIDRWVGERRIAGYGVVDRVETRHQRIVRQTEETEHAFNFFTFVILFLLNRIPPQPLDQPSIAGVDQGKSGELLVQVTPVEKAHHYEIRDGALGVGGTPPTTFASTLIASARNAAPVENLFNFFTAPMTAQDVFV